MKEQTVENKPYFHIKLELHSGLVHKAPATYYTEDDAEQDIPKIVKDFMGSDQRDPGVVINEVYVRKTVSTEFKIPKNWKQLCKVDLNNIGSLLQTDIVRALDGTEGAIMETMDAQANELVRKLRNDGYTAQEIVKQAQDVYEFESKTSHAPRTRLDYLEKVITEAEDQIKRA